MRLWMDTRLGSTILLQDAVAIPPPIRSLQHSQARPLNTIQGQHIRSLLEYQRVIQVVDFLWLHPMEHSPILQPMQWQISKELASHIRHGPVPLGALTGPPLLPVQELQRYDLLSLAESVSKIQEVTQ